MQCGTATATAIAYGSRFCCYPRPRFSIIFRHQFHHPRRPFSINPPQSTCFTRRLLSPQNPNTLFDTMKKRGFSGSGITTNKGMVENLQTFEVLKSQKVAEVMEKIDRALFVPHDSPAYDDTPLLIGYNATISAPHMHAMCLELLENHLQPGMRVLDIGSGTGYLTACFAMMVGREGIAIGVEHIPELAASSIEHIQKSEAAPLLEEGSLSIKVADGRLGYPEFAPYDAIHVGAAAPEIPPHLVSQLKPGGRMVIPVGDVFQELQVIDKVTDGDFKTDEVTSVRYVPLTSHKAQLGL